MARVLKRLKTHDQMTHFLKTASESLVNVEFGARNLAITLTREVSMQIQPSLVGGRVCLSYQGLAFTPPPDFDGPSGFSNRPSADRERRERSETAIKRTYRVELEEISVNALIDALALLFARHKVWRHALGAGGAHIRECNAMIARKAVSDLIRVTFSDAAADALATKYGSHSERIDNVLVRVETTDNGTGINLSMKALDPYRALNVIAALKESLVKEEVDEAGS